MLVVDVLNSHTRGISRELWPMPARYLSASPRCVIGISASDGGRSIPQSANQSVGSPGASATRFVFAVSETSLEPVPLLGRPAGRFGLSRAHEPIQRVVDGVTLLRVPPRPARGGDRRCRGS